MARNKVIKALGVLSGAAGSLHVTQRGGANCEGLNRNFSTADKVWRKGYHPPSMSCALGYSVDRYGGVIVNSETLSSVSAENFNQVFGKCKSFWNDEGYRKTIWMGVNRANVDLMPIAVNKFGFKFHHAEPDYVMLTLWQDESRKSPIPNNASHYCGVGAVVISKDQKVLLVQEHSGPAAARGIWKPPTGLVDVGEDVPDAALRELQEETGITNASFERVIAVRQSHGGAPCMGSKSDMFWMCMLRVDQDAEDVNLFLLSTLPSHLLVLQISLELCPTEIANARWVPIDDMRSVSGVAEGSMWCSVYGQVLPYMVKNPEAKAGMKALSLPAGFRPGNQLLFVPENCPFTYTPAPQKGKENPKSKL